MLLLTVLDSVVEERLSAWKSRFPHILCSSQQSYCQLLGHGSHRAFFRRSPSPSGSTPIHPPHWKSHIYPKTVKSFSTQVLWIWCIWRRHWVGHCEEAPRSHSITRQWGQAGSACGGTVIGLILWCRTFEIGFHFSECPNTTEIKCIFSSQIKSTGLIYYFELSIYRPDVETQFL